MANAPVDFVKVAAVEELAEGKPKAVKVEGYSIALFQHEGEVFATDNQCPHMGIGLATFFRSLAQHSRPPTLRTSGRRGFRRRR